MKLLVNAPINALSFGNVSVNILRELYKKKYRSNIFSDWRKSRTISLRQDRSQFH